MTSFHPLAQARRLPSCLYGTRGPSWSDVLRGLSPRECEWALARAAIIGGIQHGEQKYNIDSSNSYISMILVAVGIGMVLPDFIAPESWRIYSVFNIVVMLTMYGVFMRMQTANHRYFFKYPYKRHETHPAPTEPSQSSGTIHGVLLCLHVAVIGVLAELLSEFLNAGIAATGLPLALAAVTVALVSASPEILTAVRAAAQDLLHRDTHPSPVPPRSVV